MKGEIKGGIEKTGFIKKADILLIAIILIVCAILLIPQIKSKKPPIAHVFSKGVEIACVDLGNVEKAYKIIPDTTPYVEITVEPGAIYYSHAECPDKLCVNCGKLKHPGNTAACLPSETLIVIEGEKDNDSPDIITY